MRCSGCSAEVPDGNRFCGRCGAAVDPFSTETLTQPPADTDSSAGAAAEPASSPDDSRFLPGAVIAGRYRIIGLLGKGGMGEVYRADDLKLGQPVALKFLPAELEGEGRRLERFLDEVKIARQVSHPGVCRVYDVGEAEGHHYLSMEYVDGEDLDTLLRRIGRLPHDKALEIPRQLCAGLAAAHEVGVLHRDIKPSNVMLDGRGRARLTDFGLAGLAGEVRGAAVRLGTPVYMAPEQLAGREVSVRSDIYSLGMVLYEIFTGRRPFGSARSPAEASSGADATPTSPSSFMEKFDPEVERVILRCLEVDPDQRPQNALAVAAALPGGDPLAAALAAGGTPSPEMVAAAGGAGALRPAVAATCLGFALVSFVLIAALYQRYGLAQAVGLPHSAQVLAAKGREILDDAGYGPGADRAYRFVARSAPLGHVMREHPVDPWPALARARPSPVAFWYRESPVALRAGQFSAQRGTWPLREDDPPWTVPGMAGIRLDPDGRLERFYAVPPESEAPDPSASPPDWSAFFERAGVDVATARPVDPTRLPLFSRNPVAWEARLLESPERSVRVEAGSFNGRPVFFAVVPPWEADEEVATPINPLFAPVLPAIFTILLAAAVFTAAVTLARRNLRLDRSDRRGALRLAGALIAAMTVSWLLGAHHTLDGSWTLRLGLQLAWALLTGAYVWLLYVAIEPYVRRWWPEALVTWTRLLSGRFRDPGVGRDVLIGGAAYGLLTLWQVGAWAVLPDRLGLAVPGPMPVDLAGLLGTRQTVAQYFEELTTVLILPLVLMFMLVLLRLMLRRQWLTLVVFGLMWVPLSTNHPVVWIGVLYFLGTYGVFALMLVRFGILPVAVMLWLSTMDQAMVLTLDPSAWYFGSSLSSMLVFAAVLAFAFRISLGRRGALPRAGTRA